MFATVDKQLIDLSKLPVKYSELSQQERKEVRLHYCIEQDSKCYYCKGDLDLPAKTWVTDKEIDRSLFPKGFFDHQVHLHHNHDSDLTIGAVHAYCNAVLWCYEGE